MHRLRACPQKAYLDSDGRRGRWEADVGAVARRRREWCQLGGGKGPIPCAPCRARWGLPPDPVSVGGVGSGDAARESDWERCRTPRPGTTQQGDRRRARPESEERHAPHRIDLPTARRAQSRRADGSDGIRDGGERVLCKDGRRGDMVSRGNNHVVPSSRSSARPDFLPTIAVDVMILSAG